MRDGAYRCRDGAIEGDEPHARKRTSLRNHADRRRAAAPARIREIWSRYERADDATKVIFDSRGQFGASVSSREPNGHIAEHDAKCRPINRGRGTRRNSNKKARTERAFSARARIRA